MLTNYIISITRALHRNRSRSTANKHACAPTRCKIERLEPRTQLSASGAGASGSISLSETITAIKLPSSVTSGEKVAGLATIDVTNNGTATAAGRTTFALYAGATTTFSSSDTQLVSVTKSLSVKAGASKVLTIPIKSIPASLANGTYHVLAHVTDSKGGISDSASSATFTVAAVTNSISVAFQAPVPANPTTSPVTVILTNNGSTTASMSSNSYDLGYSTDAGGKNSVGGVVGGFFFNGGGPSQIKAHSSAKLRLSWKFVTVSPGTYYLTFTLVGKGGFTLATAVSPTTVTVG